MSGKVCPIRREYLNMLLGYVNGVSEKDDIHVQRCNKVLSNRAVKRDRMIRELYVFNP